MSSKFLHRLLINIGVLAGLVIILIIVLIFLGLDIKQKSNFIKDKNAEVAMMFQNANDLVRLREEYELAKPLEEKLSLMVPSRDSLFTFSNYVKTLASSDKLTSIFRFGEESGSGALRTIRFDVSLQGQSVDVTKFIKDLEASPYFVNVLSFNVVGQADRYAGTVVGTVLYKIE